MNDRAVSVLENYEIEVLRTWKGRGAILCESDKGLLILKEYAGPKDKIIFQDALLNHIKEQGFWSVENVLRTKEGELITYDQDRTPYFLKTYFEGRECNVRDRGECMQAVRTLARLHKASYMSIEGIQSIQGIEQLQKFQVGKEYEKHNKELRKVRRFLKGKSQKTNFELFLLKHYDYFLDLAFQVAEEVRVYQRDTEQKEEACALICHGDYQYHNILSVSSKGEEKNSMAVINFEKCIWDNPVRDLYLFMRKLLEKSGWSPELGMSLINAYQEERKMSKEDYIQLYYRLIYPEKFWKIVNFYYNSGKAWIPGRNMEKLEKLLGQEEEKRRFLENYKSAVGCFSFPAH